MEAAIGNLTFFLVGIFIGYLIKNSLEQKEERRKFQELRDSLQQNRTEVLLSNKQIALDIERIDLLEKNLKKSVSLNNALEKSIREKDFEIQELKSQNKL